MQAATGSGRGAVLGGADAGSAAPQPADGEQPGEQHRQHPGGRRRPVGRHRRILAGWAGWRPREACSDRTGPPRRPADGDARGPVGAAHDRARLGRGHARRHRRQRGAGADRRGPRRELRRPAVDRQRLHPDAGLADPARRLAGRPVRAPPRVRDRRGVVRGGVAAVRVGAEPGAARRGPGPAGRRRRAADPGQPGADLRVVPRPGPGRGDRRLVGAGRDRRSGRPVRRRLAGGVDLAGGVPDQPAAGGAGGRRRAPARAREPRPRGAHPASTSRARCSPRRRWRR